MCVVMQVCATLAARKTRKLIAPVALQILQRVPFPHMCLLLYRST